MEALGLKLKEYYDFLSAFSEIKARPEAKPHQIQNVKNWFEGNLYSVEPKETNFIDVEGDLITLVARPRSLLFQGLEKIPLIRRLFREVPRGDRINDGATDYFSDERIELFGAAGVTTVGLALLLGPMWGLKSVDSSVTKLAIITGFIIVFALLLFCSTTNTRQTTSYEAIAATAVYAAVLAVFMQVN